MVKLELLALLTNSGKDKKQKLDNPENDNSFAI